MTSVELRRWVMIAGTTLIALIIGADSYEAWADYRRVVADNRHLETALSRAVAEQTARMIQEVDVVFSSYTLADHAADEHGRGTQLEQIMGLPFVHSALVADSVGRVLAGVPAAQTGDSVRDLEAFTSARDHGSSLYIDRPGTAAGAARTFAVSRRVDSSDGSLAGVAVARIALDYLANFYEQINVTPDTSIRLMRSDGITLAQFPPPILRPPARVWQNKEIEAAANVAGYPVSVVVSRSLRDVLQPWIQEEESSAVRTLSLSVLAGILLMALRSALDRQERIDREKLRLEQELAGIQRVEALGLLAASVAHDFNNVLTAIVGYAELAGEAAGSSPARQNLDRLLAATERARLLVRRVLTFDPRRSVRYRPTGIAPIAVEVAEQVGATLPPSIRMGTHGLEQTVSTFGDPTEMYQVVMNLCSNAVHAMPKGGSLEIGLDVLEIRDGKSLALGQLQPGQWACLSITDTGNGLADEQIPSIFEPFYTTRSISHGTGIGLTVVRNVILRMKGALDVSSSLGTGTRMAVYWPVTSAEAAAAAENTAEVGAGQTIMVVDDERELVALTEELLASLSYEPVGFSDARAALEAFRLAPKRFDAVLTDERMQPLGGLEFARLVHAIAPHVPIILMTAHRDAAIDIRASQEGIVETLDKPLRVQTLREALSRGLSRTRSTPRE